MGSHPWKTVTTFEPDVGLALARAQTEVFKRGEYGFTHKMRSAYAASGRPLPDLPPEPIAGTIEEARQVGAESGTCSVLDVYEIGAEPAPGVAGPFPPEVIRDRIGVEHPTLAQVEAVLGEFYEDLERGASTYFVCYEHGEPSQYLFIGMSFD